MTAIDPVAAARAVAAECARAYQDVFAERLIAAYLLGSLAYGGYAPAVSDIDLAVILTGARDSDPGTVRTTSETLRGQGSLHRKLSVFWGSLPALRDGHDDGRFPALDRLELTDHSVLLLGVDVAGQVARPATDELQLASARFAVDVLATDEVTAEFDRPCRLLTDPVWFTKAVLFPVRFLCTNTKTTGRAATNDEAVDWYLAQPRAAAQSLVRLAAWVRAGHPLDPAQAAPQLAAGLIPLYRHYVDEQTRRLHRASAPVDLVTAFTRWGQRLAGLAPTAAAPSVDTASERP
ncbi:hypothetical protein SAMN05216266_106292 [Amycolatopsis marina]|uniref:Nucleotidyltransferase domain-containing protein n=1 Tax=Amycolatopsis marina TaxID=490629 RepID=A0A1I0ZD94_9PSEU|nr:nucleotidyltransferase domain-containing protein [Amycolatopsis marina]SFB23086.1 hypothetical protein SAMN05216266_106292 [Amycolatopsis marina]